MISVLAIAGKACWLIRVVCLWRRVSSLVLVSAAEKPQESRLEVNLGIADEAEARAALTHRVRRALGLDPLRGQARQRRVEIVHGQGYVTVACAELVRVDAEVVRELEPIAVAGEAMKMLTASVPDRELAPLLEPEHLVEGDRAFRIGDAVAVWRTHGRS